MCLDLPEPLAKALHSELLTKLLSRNEFFTIFEVRVERHFFVIFRKFGIEQFPKFPNREANSLQIEFMWSKGSYINDVTVLENGSIILLRDP
jgi:hypothetical protein